VGGWTRSYARSQKPTRPLPDRPISAATLAEAELELGLSGAYLKAIREYKGITLDDITERTKIQIGYLKAVEEERFEMLPAAVYVDGFVRQLARLLKLDVQKVANGYMARYTPPGPRDPDVF
jgi:flagellar biosynthesis protein FlhG